MTKIIYGVCGEGSGHSSRAREMLNHLINKGHQVKVVSYDKGYKNLQSDFDVVETEGLNIASVDNKVSVVKTFTENIKKLSEGHKKVNELRALFKSYQPDAVITDFEPMTAYLANHYDVPLISLDNQHRMRYMIYESPNALKKDQLITEAVIRAMVPKPDVSLVTTFYFGKVKNERTFLFPPILRQEVLVRKPGSGDHILVYFTSGYESFLDLLKQYDRETFIVYGYDEDRTEKNLIFKPFSRHKFLDNLANSKAVFATAGFTLMTESFYLKKPYLALPMKGQFEQQLNALWLEELKLGMNGCEVDYHQVGSFLYHAPEFQLKLNQYKQKDQNEIKSKLDELFASDCQLLQEFHRNRKRLNKISDNAKTAEK
ncbi:MAG: MJ1255/VC2487 family glycosyltransferase [Planctomycetota bacterium]